MDLLAIRERLAEVIRDTTGLPVLETPGGNIPTPSVLMGGPSARYDAMLGGVGVTVTWPLVLIVSRSHPDKLSELAMILGTGGADDRSIVDALNATPPGAVADWWRVSDFEPWADLDIGNVSYWSTVLNVEIGAS